jgi:hypothetical protein
MKNIVRINIDDTMNDLNLNIENKNVVNLLNKQSNQKGNNNVRQLYSWTKGSNIIKCYGWYDGEHDNINKHELIPNGSSKFLDDDSSTILLYGDIFLICYENNKICDFTVADYGELYSELNEGFDDCESEYDSDDSEDSVDSVDEEDEEGDGYDPEGNNDEGNDFEIITDEDSDDSEELDTDNNKY